MRNQALAPVVAEGPGRFDNALAMNVQYGPIRELRDAISMEIGYELDFFRAWNPAGEAHVTVITPVEYFDVLRGPDAANPFVSMQDIARIAGDSGIQGSDLAILGVGRGRAQIDGRTEETYFVIVESMNLRKIRQRIHGLYVERGGRPDAWNPQNFYPHITIGYSKRDLHEADGVLKDMAHSYDSRFDLILR